MGCANFLMELIVATIVDDLEYIANQLRQQLL
jgi:hypothetical protein